MAKLKLLFVLLCVIGLSGCSPSEDYNANISEIKNNSIVREYCIDGVVYIKITHHYSATVKYDKDTLLPQRCELEPKH